MTRFEAMSDPFLAFRIHRSGDEIHGELERLTLDDLNEGELVVRVEYSGINYKDALAATGTAPILRKFPLVGGIDFAGEVVESSDQRFSPGDKVVGTSGGLGEARDGGYAELARVSAENAVPLPVGFDTRAAMALGTAGFTAALAVHRLEHNGQRPDLGPVVVTGASGGVGSVAIDVLCTRGYEVVALTGKADQADYLRALGASEILDRKTLDMGTRPLERAQWGGAVDNLGGETLGWLTRTVRPWGSIASIGLAASAELRTTVMPFILRGVSLIGVNVDAPRKIRGEVWSRLAGDLRPAHLDAVVTREVSLEELPECFDAYIRGEVVGRTVVKIC
jgi:NADPH2:quinone reductase